ncbi:hypothetical protein IAD21_04686 [Abditibacteriota bacterium]|nr:hypothetical protein IAD21_04686 [Abditibacteriota bacterium]
MLLKTPHSNFGLWLPVSKIYLCPICGYLCSSVSKNRPLSTPNSLPQVPPSSSGSFLRLLFFSDSGFWPLFSPNAVKRQR